MSKFNLWIESVTPTNCQTQEGFENDSQRKNGFVGGTGASAIRVNSGLRQANLVACALMEAIGDTENDLTSDVTDVKDSILNYFNTFDVKNNVVTFTQANEKANISSNETLSIILGKISKYFADLKSLAYKDKIETTDISNGSISKDKIVTGIINDYDTAKGTVETRFNTVDERLTRLGFNEGEIVSTTDLTMYPYPASDYGTYISRMSLYAIIPKGINLELRSDGIEVRVSDGTKIAQLPDTFAPESDIILTTQGEWEFEVTIKTDGGIYNTSGRTFIFNYKGQSITIDFNNFGYKVKAIE